MVITTRSHRIRRALASVIRRIPPEDQRILESFVRAIDACREWQPVGLLGPVDERSAQCTTCLAPDFKTERGANIIFHLPVCRLYSDRALVGVVAHEFGHARRFAQHGAGWEAAAMKRYAAEERLANQWARRWGFGAEIAIMHRERAGVLVPTIRRCQRAILQAMRKREEREERRLQARFE